MLIKDDVLTKKILPSQALKCFYLCVCVCMCVCVCVCVNMFGN